MYEDPEIQELEREMQGRTLYSVEALRAPPTWTTMSDSEDEAEPVARVERAKPRRKPGRVPRGTPWTDEERRALLRIHSFGMLEDMQLLASWMFPHRELQEVADQMQDPEYLALQREVYLPPLNGREDRVRDMILTTEEEGDLARRCAQLDGALNLLPQQAPPQDTKERIQTLDAFLGLQR